MTRGGLIPGAWKAATIDFDRGTTEFTGDDDARYTDLVNLDGSYEFITVIIPALSASATVTPYIQMVSGIATIPVAMAALDADATGHFAHATSSGAGSIVVVFRIGGAEFVRLYCNADQTANRIFYVRGFNR